jgi:hypothetical protein
MKYLKKYKLFESIIIDKREFPDKADILEYFYDFTDEESYTKFDISSMGYVFFPSSDITSAVKQEMFKHMIEGNDWMDKESISLGGTPRTKWSEFFKPVNELKDWDMPDFLPIDKIFIDVFNDKLYHEMGKGTIPAYSTIEISIRGFLEENLDILIECLERFYESTGFRPVGDLKTEDFVDEDNGDIVTLYMAELKLCKCDDIEYKGLIKRLGQGIEKKKVRSSGYYQTTSTIKNSLLLKKFL